MARKKKDRSIQKDKFIQASMGIFFKKGYEETSIRDILMELGEASPLSPSVFYYYFNSKDELFEACLDTYVERYANDMVNFLKDDSLDYAAKMCKIIDRVNDALHDLYFIQSEKSVDHHKIIHYVLLSKFFEIFAPALAELIGNGLESGLLPMTELAKETDTFTISKIILSGIPAIFHDNPANLCDTGHNAENARLIPAFVAQILGLPFSAFGIHYSNFKKD